MRIGGAVQPAVCAGAGLRGSAHRPGLAVDRSAERPEPRHRGSMSAGHLSDPHGGRSPIVWQLSVAGAHDLSFQTGRLGGAWPWYQTASVTIGPPQQGQMYAVGATVFAGLSRTMAASVALAPSNALQAARRAARCPLARKP